AGASEMEAEGPQGPRERRGEAVAQRPEQNHVQPQPTTNRLPKHTYWLDLWLFIFLDIVLFFFVYLLP
uniref:Chromosome 4 open reading frame 3 n=1 Tax=Cavia porcellus TaxID=10141 RepID=H0WD58_CAVPO